MSMRPPWGMSREEKRRERIAFYIVLVVATVFVLALVIYQFITTGELPPLV